MIGDDRIINDGGGTTFVVNDVKLHDGTTGVAPGASAPNGTREVRMQADAGAVYTEAGRLQAEVGYGFAAFETGLLTPYAGTVLAEGADRTYRLGTRWQGTRGLTLNLEGTRQEPAGPQPLNQGLRLDLTWGF